MKIMKIQLCPRDLLTSCDDDLDGYNWTVMDIAIIKQTMTLMIRSMMILVAMLMTPLPK